MRDLYSMEYISESPNKCSKGVLQCVQICTNIPRNKVIGYMSQANCSSLYQKFKKIVDFYNKKGGKLIFPILTMNSYPHQNN